MTISATTYRIIFRTVIVLIAAAFHFAGKRKGQKKSEKHSGHFANHSYRC